MRLVATIVSTFAFAVGVVAGAAAQPPTVVSDAPREIAVTIYPDDLAMITETRRVDLPAGRSTIAFKGVNDRIIPETALVTKFSAVSIERNFDFDLISKAALFENAVGQEVTLIRTYLGSGEVKVERAKVISGAQGVVFQIGDRVESFQCSNLTERVKFDERPPQFQAEPTLSLTVNAERAGPQQIEFRYLASGFRWSADYILTERSKTTGSMIGWLTATNETNFGIRDAELSIVAGDLSRLGRTAAPFVRAKEFFAHCLPNSRRAAPMLDYGGDGDMVVVTGARLESDSFAAREPIAQREDLGDYKLYKTPQRTSIEARQTKQVLFLNKPNVRFKKRYAFDFSKDYEWALERGAPDVVTIDAAIRYEIDNSRRGRLGEPLPRGTIRVMTNRKNDQRFYLGQDHIENLAVDAPAKVDIGYVSEILTTRRRLSRERITRPNGQSVTSFEEHYEISNLTGEAADIEVAIPLLRDELIKNANLRMRKERPVATWRLKIRSGATRILKIHRETTR